MTFWTISSQIGVDKNIKEHITGIQEHHLSNRKKFRTSSWETEQI